MLKYHIQTIELGSAQNAIQFNSIPQNYDDLYVVWSTRYVSENTTKTSIFFNNLSSNFSYRLLQGDGSSTAVGTNTLALGGINNGNNTTANAFSNNQMLIPNYRSNLIKSYSVDAVNENNATTSFQDIWTGLWNNTEPITSLTISGTSALAIGSSVSLYGIRRGTDGIINLQPAYGGTITTSGGYTIHTFNSSGTFTTTRPLQCEYLVIAGGGAGGLVNYNANATTGGGGAGGYRTSVVGAQSGGGASAEAILSLPAQGSYAVVVGGGAPGATSVSVNGTSGVSSSFAGISTVGGGGGSSGESGVGGASGGSGGGGAFRFGTPPGGAGTANQGFAGGNPSSNINTGGGGGGAGAAGVSQAANSDLLYGGAGLANSITGTSIIRARGGQGSYAGGSSFIDGPAGSGSGGFGYSTSLSPNRGGNGGSGVVIIRYLTP
jgi:hypothetical protein